MLEACEPLDSKAVPLTLAMRAATDVPWARAVATEYVEATAATTKTWTVLPRMRAVADPAINASRRLRLVKFHGQ